MIRRFVLLLMLAFAMVAALPAATSAKDGDPHGGRICSTEETTLLGDGCVSGGDGQGGGDGHQDFSYGPGDGNLRSTMSGGGGQGGGGSRICTTDLGTGEKTCSTGRHVFGT